MSVWLIRIGVLFALCLPWSGPPAHAQSAAETLLSSHLADHSAMMLMIEPETGAILDANAAALRFYGYSLPQMRTMRIQDINTLGADEVGLERRRAMAEKRTYFIFPHRLASGELRTVEVYSAPYHDDSGRNLLLSVIRDITGKAVAEGELAAYRSRLEELVTRRTTEANDAQSRLRFWMTLGLAIQTVLIVALVIAVARRHSALKEVAHEANTRRRAEEKLALANADLQRFAEIAAHHLQEPTRRLILFSQRLAKLIPRGSNENAAFTLDTIEEQASYLHALVRDVQVYLASASPLGPMTLQDPARILEQISADMGTRLRDCHASLDISPLPKVVIDAPRLRYMLNALIDNCLVHTHADTPLTIRASGENRNGRAVLRIADNGPGIPPEYRTRVMEVFEHLHPVAGKRPGTGLGLAVVRRIVESCDGHVRIEDAPLGGTQVVLDLPGEDV